MRADEAPSQEKTPETDGSAAPAPPSAVDADEQALAQRIISSLTEASQRLNENTIDDSTVALQKSAVSDIETLLARLRASAQPSPQDSDSSAQSSSRSQSSQGSTSSQSNRNPDAAQSSEQAQGETANPQAELGRRRDLAQSVWGHLPPKVQEDLRRSFSERFAPKYEEMIRRYYEALARQPRPEGN